MWRVSIAGKSQLASLEMKVEVATEKVARAGVFAIAKPAKKPKGEKKPTASSNHHLPLMAARPPPSAAAPNLHLPLMAAHPSLLHSAAADAAEAAVRQRFTAAAEAAVNEKANAGILQQSPAVAGIRAQMEELREQIRKNAQTPQVIMQAPPPVDPLAPPAATAEMLTMGGEADQPKTIADRVLKAEVIT